ncbi:transcriptional regulator [Halobellus rarus]|uniref:Transcriptional regulator n=1 Tax=Halobellus rarus TaxID=1126237 RepID=A0ABD6CPR3_9EURY|nr:transcriptional regulator [Halobellus rarus]
MSTTTNTLKITFGQADDHRTAARKRLERAEAGETNETIEQDAQFILNFEDFTDVERLMRTSNLELLEAIVDERPESIRETSEIVERDYREVHRNLEDLEELGVIEFEEGGGRKRPILRGGSETLDFSFRISQGDFGDTQPASV